MSSDDSTQRLPLLVDGVWVSPEAQDRIVERFGGSRRRLTLGDYLAETQIQWSLTDKGVVLVGVRDRHIPLLVSVSPDDLVEVSIVIQQIRNMPILTVNCCRRVLVAPGGDWSRASLLMPSPTMAVAAGHRIGLAFGQDSQDLTLGQKWRVVNRQLLYQE